MLVPISTSMIEKYIKIFMFVDSKEYRYHILYGFTYCTCP